MSRRRRRLDRKTNWFGPIAATLLMGGVAYAVSTSVAPEGVGGIRDSATTPTVEATVHVTSTVFEVGLRVPQEDRDQLFSLELSNGEARRMEVKKGWRVERLQESSSLKLISNEERRIALADGDEWNVILRAPTGEAYSEPRILGMFDDRHAAIIARTDSIRVLSVARSGQILSLADVPINGNVIGFSGGAVWISTFTQGEGIESEPLGPSSLTRIMEDGTSEEIGFDEDSVIVGVVSDGERHAYWRDNGFVAKAEGKTFSGDGRPLLWFKTGELLVAKGVTLLVYRDGIGETLHSTFTASPVTARLVE